MSASAGFDFDLHGLVGVRLLGATDRERAMVLRQLGPIERPLARAPEITIRFVDRLAIEAPERLIGVDDAAYAGDAFFLIRGTRGAPARVQIPFDRLGWGCELVCERGLDRVPLLIAIINLTVLAKGGLAMHASAFRYGGSDTLVTGWSKGGKTELLLGFIARGARYIGDEWIYWAGEGKEVVGIPEPVRVWDWHLAQLDGYRRRLPRARRVSLALLRALSALLHRVSGDGRRAAVDKLAALVDRQRYAHLEPRAAFGPAYGSLRGTIRRAFFVESQSGDPVTVAPIRPDAVAARMAFSLQEERDVLMREYRKFRFAFPGRANPLIESAARLEQERLREFFRGLVCHTVHHPYPPSIQAMTDAVLPHVERRPAHALAMPSPHTLLGI